MDIKPWKAELRARVAYYDYDLQRTAFVSGPLREKWLVTFSAKVTYSFSKKWNAFAEYELNESLSNRGFEEYTVNTARAGLRWNVL